MAAGGFWRSLASVGPHCVVGNGTVSNKLISQPYSAALALMALAIVMGYSSADAMMASFLFAGVHCLESVNCLKKFNTPWPYQYSAGSP